MGVALMQLGSWRERRRARARHEAASKPAGLPAHLDPAEMRWAGPGRAPLEASSSWGARPDNWWQLGWNPPSSGYGNELAAVHACQSIIAQSVAPVRLRHMRPGDDVLEEVTGSRWAELMMRPNHYQTGLEFLFGQLMYVLGTGSAYAYAERDGAGRIAKFHPWNAEHVTAKTVSQSGSIFYEAPLSAYEPPRPTLVPARDVWHFRARTDATDPLKGISPLQALVHTSRLQTEIQKTSAEFFENKARPGGILHTDKDLDPKQSKLITQAWERAARTGFRGTTAVVDRGLQYQDLTVSAVDAGLVEQYELTVTEIARAHGVPPWKIGQGDPSYSNAETMDRAFYVSSLRFWFHTIERSLTKFSRMPSGHSYSFAIEEYLAPSDDKTMYDGLARAIQGAVLTPNEARKKRGLPPKEGGDQLYVQQQMIPIDQAGKQAAPPMRREGDQVVPNPDEDEAAE
jgi:HK97 family phage portal protein